MTNILHSALWNSRRGGVDVFFAGGQTLASIAIPANQKLGARDIFAVKIHCVEIGVRDTKGEYKAKPYGY